MPKWTLWSIVLLGLAASIWAIITQERRLTILAGPVVAPTGTHDLQSSFTIKPPPFFENPILTWKISLQSHGSAGACLLADASALDPALASPKDPSECEKGLPTQTGVNANDTWAAYYLGGQCWIRGLGSKYCVKSGTDNGGLPWANGTYGVPLKGTVNADDMYAEMKRRGARGKFSINWMTYACLNPVNPSKRSEDILTCGGVPPPPEPLHRQGPITTLP
jgi:hypothetical protein